MKKVLLVDDAATARLFHRKILEGIGCFQVDEAANGYEALEKVLCQEYDLLLVDVNMPKMDGYAFLKTLRQDDQGFGGVPTIIISTESEIRDARAALLVGANMYLNKPVKPEVLERYSRLLTGEAQ